METKRDGGERQRILSFVVKDERTLCASYMPFVKNGGLFIPTTTSYSLGEELFLLLQLMDQKERIPVAGKVVWITPLGAEGNRQVGVGIQFSDQDNGIARRKIEDYLPAASQGKYPTHTM